MKLLCLSNGHGEDAIALRILRALQQNPSAPEVAALPLVGVGHAFADHNIPVVGPVKPLPSGGFNRDGRQMARDVRGGLLTLTWQQLQTVKAWAASGGRILAVGDLVPLLFAWLSGAPYIFVGTAKSEYYLRDEEGWLPRNSWFTDRTERWLGSVYYPWERWLMSRPRCKAVFPRDRITSEILGQWKIPIFDVGNPMMDGLEPTGVEFPTGWDSLTVALIPGSRAPEVYDNWQQMLQAVSGLVEGVGRKLVFLAAIAPSVDRTKLHQALTTYGWRNAGGTVYKLQSSLQGATLLLTSDFNDCIHAADVAIAMAGTATEQFVGLGKPALLLPGQGPQFTPAFAEAQTRLLGPSAILVAQPNQTTQVLQRLLNDPDRLQLIAENGRRRMGSPGASDRIAACLIERLT